VSELLDQLKTKMPDSFLSFCCLKIENPPKSIVPT
jgi:hypothetical protein